MPIVTLSQALLDRLPRGPVDLRDRKLPGFLLRVRRSGRHTYFVNYHRHQWLKLGDAAATTLEDARREAGAVLAALARGDDPKPKPAGLTFRTFLDTVYVPWLKTERRSWAHVEQRLRKQFVPWLGDLPLDQISTFRLEQWKGERRRQTWLDARRRPGRSAVTIDRDLADLKACLRRAVAWGYLGAYPLDGLTRARRADDAVRPIVRFLSPDEEARLRAALTARDDARRAAHERYRAWLRERHLPDLPEAGAYFDHLQPLVLLLLNTGLRRGEALGLRWADVEGARLVVRGEGTKTGRSRSVPLNAEAVAVLAAWKPADARPVDLVFPGADGARIASVKTAFRRLLADAGITRFRLHDCRHHFASRLVQAGVSLPVVGALLGHRTAAMTMRYAHLSDDVLAGAVAKLEAVR